MHCGECAYDLSEVDGAICRRCGRYFSAKAGEFSVVLMSALMLAAASNYLLTARVFSGNKLLWLRSALTAPESIYSSRLYLGAVVVSLAGPIALSALAGFHYGAVGGLLLAFPAGLLWGAPVGWIVLPAVAVIAGLPRWRIIPPLSRAAVAALAGGLYIVWLAFAKGPSRSPLHREMLTVFAFCILGVSVVASLAAAAASARMNFRSGYLAYVSGGLSAVVLVFTVVGVTPSRLEANLVLAVYSPERLIEGRLGEGFTSGVALTAEPDMAREKQLGHVFEALQFVDLRRAEAARACDRYLGRFPDAGQAADVMLLRAAMHDARVDMRALKHFNRLECYFNMITPEGAETFKEVIERFPGSAQSALARFHFAEWEFQSGKITEAHKTYVLAEKELAAVLPTGYRPIEVKPPRTPADLFGRNEAVRIALHNRAYEALVTARRRRAVIANNRDYGWQPLTRFAGLDPRLEDFDRKATQLASDYRDSLIADNVKVALAVHMPDPVERAAAIEHLLGEYPTSDVRDEMLLLLAKARLAGDLSGDGRRKAETALRRLLADYPESTWAREARDMLDRLTARRADR
jgi:outer membrane protein assembly factor BamD (BamD/ComL family)